MKKISLIILSASAIAALAACGGGSSPAASSSHATGLSTSAEQTSHATGLSTEETSAGETSTAEATSHATGLSTETTSQETLPEDDPTSEVKIEFWHCMGHAKSNQVQIIADAFNEEYKGKYKVVCTKLAGEYTALAEMVKTKLAGKEMAAMAMGYPDNFSDYMTADISRSKILRLDSMLNDPNVGYSSDEIDDFVPAFLDEGRHYQFEGTWSMPMYKSTEIMYYNANMLAGDNVQSIKKLSNDLEWNTALNVLRGKKEEATDEELANFKALTKAKGGFTYEVPVKWDEMVTFAETMKADMAAMNVEDSNFFPVGYDSDANLMISQFAQRGIDYTTNDNIQKKEDHILFDNEDAHEFTEHLVDLFKRKLLVTKGISEKYTNEKFTEGTTAVSIGSTGGSTYNVSSTFKVKLAPVPYYGSKPMYIQQGPSICFMDNKNPYIHKGAWLFYKKLAEPLNNAMLALENSYDPVRNSSFTLPEYKEMLDLHDEDLKYDIPYHTKDLRQYYMTSPVFKGSGTARTEIGKILTYVCNSGYDIDEAFEYAKEIAVEAI